MKNLLHYALSLFMLFLLGLPSQANDIIIVGLLDGPLSGAPKFVELYVVNDIPDLSIYGLGSAKNGGGTDGQEYTFPADAVSAGSTIFVVNRFPEFLTFMGFNADYEDGGAACNFNGDDALELYKDGAVIDVFGEIAIDGTGTTWEYGDGWVKRKNGTGPDGTTFVEGNWTIGGIDIFDNQETNATSPNPYPLDPYSPDGGTGGPTVDLVLKGVIHGSADVKVTEFEVLNDIPDLSLYSIGVDNNGGGSDGPEWTFPSESASAGDRIYVARDSAAFVAFFGFEADYYDPDGDAHNFNGDDGIEIYKEGEVVEIFGDSLADGTGLPWEYTNGWAHRIDGTGPDTDGFVQENWEFSALDNFVDVATNDTAPEPYPVEGSTGGNADDLVLVGIIHAGADVKVSEYYVLDNIPDLSIYGVGCANNGGGSDGEEWTFPAESASAGDRIYVARNFDAFVQFFGFEPTFLDTTGAAHNFNGDDGFELFGNGEVIDLYGDVVDDGTGLAWEYSDTWAQRECATGPDGATFIQENWIIATLDNLDGITVNTDAAEPYPVDRYQTTPCDGNTGGDSPRELVITEIMYNSPGSDLEYVEFFNNTADPIDMTGYNISDAITYTFPTYTLNPGEYVLISDDSVSMQNFWDVESFTWESGSLNNGGEPLTLKDALGEVVDSVRFDDAAPWTTTPDGRGPSLVLCDPDSDNNDGANWQRAITSSGNFADGREVFGNPGVAANCIAEPIIAIQAAEAIVGEADGSITVLFYIDNPSPNETTVDLSLVGGGSADENDFTFMPGTITFPAMTDPAQMVTIGIIDDSDQEPEEAFAIEISNPSNGAIITNSTMNITIVDNDAPITNSLKLIGLIHGPLSGVPKAAQLYAINDIPNLGLFGLGCANNGGGTDGQEYTFPNVSIDAGTCFWVANDTAAFRQFFGFPADFQDDGSANNFNGDDAFEVFENGETIDVFGEVDADGTGTAWEYSLGWVHRVLDSGPDGNTFVLDNWEISPIEVYVGTETADQADPPYPLDMCSSTSTNVVDLSSFIQVYPNPATDRVQIESDIEVDAIKVSNLLGQEMLSIKKPNSIMSIDISSLPSEVYVISFITTDGIWTQKLIVNR